MESTGNFLKNFMIFFIFYLYLPVINALTTSPLSLFALVHFFPELFGTNIYPNFLNKFSAYFT